MSENSLEKAPLNFIVLTMNEEVIILLRCYFILIYNILGYH